jgi:hypothetical protein
VKIENGKVIFSSGRVRNAYRGIIGLSPEGDVTEGYDGGFWTSDIPDSDIHDDPLTQADLVELADFMIARWTEFKLRS